MTALPSDDLHRFVVVSSDYSHPFMAGAYPTLERAIRAQGGHPDRWEIFERVADRRALPSQEDVARVIIDHFGPKLSGTAWRNEFLAEDTAAAILALFAQAAPCLPPAGESDEQGALLVTDEGQDGWRDIASAPKDGTKFDAWVPDAFGGHRMTGLSIGPRRTLRQHGILTGADLPRQPTHWMPLPAAPLPEGKR